MLKPEDLEPERESILIGMKLINAHLTDVLHPLFLLPPPRLEPLQILDRQILHLDFFPPRQPIPTLAALELVDGCSRFSAER